MFPCSWPAGNGRASGAVKANFEATNGGAGGTGKPLWYVKVTFAPAVLLTGSR